jgi:BirA family transcriptional regulator, biotin operon repressor / biotin---[acetyl-CoA-carboxylase] ligase
VESERLLRVLADGELHSGEELAHTFGVTRAAVWKQVAKLGRWGLSVTAVRGLGYRLDRAIDLLDAGALRAALPEPVAARIARLDLFTEIGSTNRHLLEQPSPEPGRLDVCIAEFQSEGRGRRGRRWSAPLGGGLCLSVAWQFADAPRELAALTLAVGVTVRRALSRACGLQIELKWPNDLVWDDRKLGGILLELTAEAQGGCHVVAGIGLNVALPTDMLVTVSDWPRGAVDLATALGRAPPSRTALAAALIEDLAALFADYAGAGFRPYRADWKEADYLLGRHVRLAGDSAGVDGTAVGIDADGALLIETAAGIRRRVVSGDVSVRSAP